MPDPDSNRSDDQFDVVVVGAGPNGLAAAITAARAGMRVLVMEGASTIGGACRSERNQRGVVHDVGSAIHPLTVASPFMNTIDWAGHGLVWITPPAAVAHPLDGGRAAMVWNDLDRTATELGADADAYRTIFGPATRRFDDLLEVVLSPAPDLIRPAVRHAGLMARLAPLLVPATVTARRLRTERARAILAGHAAHSVAPLSHPLTTGFALLLGAAAHAVGWPFPRGGAGEITRVMAEVLRDLGGEIRTGSPISDLDQPRPGRATVFTVTPGQLLSLDRGRFSARYRRRLQRFRYGPGVCKVDFDLSEPVPWANADVARAATVHIGGSFAEIAEAEADVARGRHPDRPFVLAAQHTLFDDTRGPGHTLWAYCHVPNGSTVDVSGAIQAQIERFAPGFDDTIVHRRVWLPADLEAANPNLVGGDVAGGSNRGLGAVVRPRLLNPYQTDVPNLFIGSAGTPPGGGVHGMAGHQAALRMLAHLS